MNKEKKMKKTTPHELKDQVPHGYGLKIAAKAGVTPEAVSKHMNGVLFNDNVEAALIEILEELHSKRKKLERRKQQLLKQTA